MLAVVAILTLAIGIGPCTAIFSVIKGVLLRPLPYQDTDRIVYVWGTWRDDRSASISAPNFVDLREQSTVFESCSIYAPLSYRFGNDPTRISGLGVAAGFFDVFGVDPLFGRTFIPSEERGDARSRVVILSYGLWQARFGGDPEIVGKTIEINGRTPTVVGIMPEGFGTLPTRESSHYQYQLWTPLNLDQPNFQIRRIQIFNMVARLRTDVSMGQAQLELDSLARYLEQVHPEDNRDRGLRLESLKSVTVGEVEPLLNLLMVAVGIVLLIACSNVANLLLARAVDRQGEIAARLSFGARWWHVFRLLLSEAILISILAGAAGFFMGAWSVDLLIALSPDQIGRLQGVEVDSRVMIFSLLVSLLAGLLVAAAPCLRVSRVQLRDALAAGGLRGKGEHSRKGLSSYLVVVEVALAILLMTSAVAMVKSLQRLLDADTGFEAEHVVTTWVDRYSPELLERLASLPGVEAAGAVSVVPIGSPSSKYYLSTFSAEGRSRQELGEDCYAYLRTATPGYFKAMDIQILKGRGFLPGDEPGVAVISQSMAESVWPGESPLGRRITVELVRSEEVRIIGVVESVRQVSLEQAPLQDIYTPWTTSAQRGLDIVIRSRVDVSAAARSMLKDSCREEPQLRSLQELVEETVAGKRFVIWLLGVLSGISTLLALVGVYGSFSYWVSTQAPALAIRAVLGAKPRDLMALVLGRCLVLVSVGVVAGLIASLLLGRLSASYLPGMSLLDPAAYLTTAVGFVGMTIAAAIGPAWWAARVNPEVALRYE